MNEDALLVRLNTIHSPDCSIFEGNGPIPVPVLTPEDLQDSGVTEEVACYAEDCRPVFEALRRVIGQLSGLLVLAQVTDKTGILDFDEYKNARNRCREAQALSERLRAPEDLGPHLEQLRAALSFSDAAVERFAGLRSHACKAEFDAIGANIKRAYAHLRAASSERAGLSMVDLTNACCSCGRHSQKNREES